MGLFKELIKKVMGYKEVEFNVAGVTFKNGRRTRQAILRAIKYHDEPYQNGPNVTIHKAEFEGEPAIEVHTGDELVGYVPKDMIDTVMNAWTTDYLIESATVIGSGKDAPFGFRVKILFNK